MCILALKGMNWVVLKTCRYLFNTAEPLSILIYVRTRFIKRGICWLWLLYFTLFVSRASVGAPGEPVWPVTREQRRRAESRGMLPLVTHQACNDSFLPQHWCYSEENTFLVLSCQNWPVGSLYSAICRVLAPAWYDLASGVITQNNWPHSTNLTFHTNN